MSFKEKSAWISFACIVMVFGTYFYALFSAISADLDASPADYPEFVTWFYRAIVLVIVLEVVLHIAIAIRSPKEALTPSDERERLISLQSTRIAYIVLAICTLLLAPFVVHHHQNPWLFGNAILFAFALGEAVRFGSQIVYYRRGA